MPHVPRAPNIGASHELCPCAYARLNECMATRCPCELCVAVISQVRARYGRDVARHVWGEPGKATCGFGSRLKAPRGLALFALDRKGTELSAEGSGLRDWRLWRFLPQRTGAAAVPEWTRRSTGQKSASDRSESCVDRIAWVSLASGIFTQRSHC